MLNLGFWTVVTFTDLIKHLLTNKVLRNKFRIDEKLFSIDSYLWISLIYWIILLIKLLTRNDLEMGDTFSFLLYCLFIFIHWTILIFKFIFRNNDYRKNIIARISTMPLFITGFFILLTTFSYLTTLV